MINSKNKRAMREAINAIQNLGEPGSGAAFVRALDAAFPAYVDERPTCKTCKRHTHASRLWNGECGRCQRGL